jgi:sulfite reductase (NADPH) flavoprotein alpha-component
MSQTAVSTNSELFSATAISPFGLPLDPYEIKGKILSTKYNVVLGTSYLLSTNIFNYELPTISNNDENNLIQLWLNLKRKNLFNEIPNLYNLEISPDSGNLLLGYLKNCKESATLIASTDALINFAPALISHSNNEYHSLPLSIQLSTVSYNFKENELISTYADALSIAKNLKLPVLTSTNAIESQLFTVISNVLAKFNIANIHLFNGLESIKINESLNGLLSSNQLKDLSEKLFSSLKNDILSVKKTEILSLSLKKLNELLNSNYSIFEFYGNLNSKIIYAIYPTKESIVSLIKSIDSKSEFGIILIKSPIPFESNYFNSLISSNVSKIIVISEKILNNSISSLKLDIQASLFFQSKFNIEVIDETIENFLIKFNSNLNSNSSVTSFKFLFNDNSKFIELPSKLTHSLSLIQDLNIKFRPIYDNTINSGLFQANIEIGNGFNYSSKFDFILIEDLNILNSINIFDQLKENSNLIILNNDEKVFDELKIIEKSLSIKIKKLLAINKINLKFLDLNLIGEVEETKGRTESIAIQTIFWSLNYPSWDKHAVVTKILQFFGSEAELLASVIADQVENAKNNGLKEIKFDEEWIKLEEEEEDDDDDSSSTNFVNVKETSFKPNPREAFIDNINVKTENQSELTKKLLFKEAYGTETSLRPDQPVKNFIVKVKENKRLTPNDYDRNIFHIEFDISNTDLTYNIGEALGIHGRNNSELVEEFIKMYGLNGNELIEISSKDDNKILEVRTLRQSLIENLDLFGKPPKRFYESLIEFATNEDEKKKLQELISPSGAILFKKFQDEEFYTFADIFEIFKSVRPNAKDLVQLISPLKRREYSIASSQKLHPNEVHLLIVVVDWIDNKGRKRFGQCSKYISDLKIGDELVVSVKPSIMKLPPLTTQPIIMAGLGTGLAPFKAFIEERQYQLEHGEKIGEIYLYLGSRHKRQEYLYGEYWEAYMDSNILTHLGAAFSRDQIKKIYIQDRIRENLKELKDLIINKNGHFYLCGPTWPVPDISACLQDIFEDDAAEKNIKIDSAKAVEDMKEEGKYVLEVY